MNNTFTKKEIQYLIKKSNDIYPRIYIHDSGKLYREKFKQLKMKDEYYMCIISSFGRLFRIILSKNDNISIIECNQYINARGYITINLKSNTYEIHRLVALNFIKNYNPKRTQVNHIDGIKTHNGVWNLEWCTPKENVRHAELHHLRNHAYGTKHPSNKHSVKTIKKVCKMLESNRYTISEIAKETGLKPQMVRHIHDKRAWTSISKDYNIDNFTNYETKSDDYKKRRKKQIQKACRLIQSNKYNMQEIANISGLTYKEISSIIHGTKYQSISSKYDLTKFSQYKYKKKVLFD